MSSKKEFYGQPVGEEKKKRVIETPLFDEAIKEQREIIAKLDDVRKELREGR